MAEKFVPVRAAKKKLYYIFRTYGTPECIRRAIYKIFDKLPAADVAPVKHGHWEKGKGNERPTESGFIHDDRYFCDCCGWGCCCETKLDFSFCPNCGAKLC